jgi:uncharacterized C2H2 Zn-finger protein
MFKCEQCDKYYNRKDILVRHVKVHSGTRFTCGECPATFRHRDYLTRHVKIKHGMYFNILLY